MTRTGTTSRRRALALPRCCLLLAAAVLGIASVPLHADEGPIVLAKPAKPSFLTLDPFTGSISLSGITELDTSKSGSSAINSSTEIFQETATVGSGGGIVSRSFFNWAASGTFGLEQTYFHSSIADESSTSNGLVQNYNINASLLPETILPSTYYARRSESYITPAFQPMVKDVVTDYGAALSLNSQTLPSFLTIFHTDTVQTQLGGAPQYKLSEDHVQFQTSYDPNEHHHLDLSYEYVMVGQNDPEALLADYQTQTLAANHTWQIDGAGKYTLSQSLNYSSQTGIFAFDHLRLDEQLRMRHTDRFETDLEYTFDQQDYTSSSSTSNQITASFTHRLFESLTTSGQIGASTTSNSFSETNSSDSGSAGSTAYFTTLAFDYNKKVPLGTLGANLSLGFNQTDNGAIGTTQTVLNDLETFTDPQPIILTRAGLNPHSIAVFNAAGTRQYLPGIDYTIVTVGNTVQIRRPITSNINPGDTVRLNYDIEPLPGYSLASTHFGAGLHYDFTEGALAGLGLYTQYFQQDQSVSASPSSTLVLADNIRDLIVGARYNFWKITLQAEYEHHESTLSPYAAERFSARYVDRFSERSDLTLTGTQTFLTYPINSEQNNITTIDGRYNYQISRELKAILSATWQNNEDNRFGNTMGFQEQGELRWKVRQTEIYLLLRHTDLESSSGPSQSIGAQFGIIRNF